VAVKNASIRWSVVFLLAGLLALPRFANADAQSKIITLGADLTPEQEAALRARFQAVDGVDKILKVSAAEMTEAMQNIYPLPPGYKAISSTALTCGAPGSGLHVTTENITNVTAGMYAGALLTAGVGDAELVVAAPAGAEAEGMTALTGVFKGFGDGACNRGDLNPQRRELAYRWLATTARLGDALGDQNAAAKLMLSAQQGLITGGKSDPAAVEPALDNAVKASGIAVPAEQRGPALELLRQMAEAKIDWGAYATGWNLEQINSTEVRLSASGAGEGAPPQTVPKGGNAAIDGTVRSPMAPGSVLVIDAPGQQQQLNLRANSVVVTRNGNPAQLADLQPGDRVSIQVGPGGVAQRIDARSAGAGAAGAASGSRIVVGTVNANDEGRLMLMTANGSQQFEVPKGAYVARDGKATQIGAVKAQDSATVVVSSVGEVQAVYARPNGREYLLDGAVRAPSIVDQTLQVRSGSQTVGVPVPPSGIPVTRNGKPAQLTDIQPNDQVTVRFNELNQPTAIEARSGRFGLLSRLNPGRQLLLCLLPLLLLLALLFWRRDQARQILLVLPGRRRRVVNPDDVDDLLGIKAQRLHE
jgi:uncharacterized protein YpuA (DUF1002 family)